MTLAALLAGGVTSAQQIASQGESDSFCHQLRDLIQHFEASPAFRDSGIMGPEFTSPQPDLDNQFFFFAATVKLTGMSNCFFAEFKSQIGVFEYTCVVTDSSVSSDEDLDHRFEMLESGLSSCLVGSIWPTGKDKSGNPYRYRYLTKRDKSGNAYRYTREPSKSVKFFTQFYDMTDKEVDVTLGIAEPSTLGTKFQRGMDVEDQIRADLTKSIMFPGFARTVRALAIKIQIGPL